MSMKSKSRLKAAVFALISALSYVAHADSGQGVAADTEKVKLFVASTPRPGIVEGCELYVYAETTNNPWREVTEPIQLRWLSGELSLNSEANHPDESISYNTPKLQQEMCFRLKVDGNFVVGGAIVSQHSARIIRFPVLALQLTNDLVGLPTFNLHAQWPPNIQADDNLKAIQLLHTRQLTKSSSTP